MVSRFLERLPGHSGNNLIATPTVAGLAAYFASLPSVKNGWDAENLDGYARVRSLYGLLTEPARLSRKGKIEATAKWPRNYRPGEDPNYPDAIWNGITRAQLRQPRISFNCFRSGPSLKRGVGNNSTTLLSKGNQSSICPPE